MPLPEPLSAAARLPWEDRLTLDPAGPDLPGVSVVIPIFNAAGFLEKTLRSLLCNDLDGVELILMDGGSTDGTMRIVEHYRDIFAVVVSERDRGQSDAINKGFERATRPILYWLNGDDIILPNALTAVRRAFRDAPGTEVIVGNAYMTEIDFTPIRHFTYSPATLSFDHLLDYAANHLVQPGVFFTRQAWNAAGPVKLDQHYAMDADLFLGMAARFAFRHLDRDLAYSVYHEGCKTRGSRAESITELAMVQAAHGGLAEARRTLDLLVDLYRKAESAAAPPPAAQGEDDVLRQRLLTLETRLAETRAVLLAEDLELT